MQFRRQRAKPEEPAAIAPACRLLAPGIPMRRGLHCHLDGIRQPPVHYYKGDTIGETLIPLLSRGGVAARQRKSCEATLACADGVVLVKEISGC